MQTLILRSDLSGVCDFTIGAEEHVDPNLLAKACDGRLPFFHDMASKTAGAFCAGPPRFTAFRLQKWP